MASRIPSEYEWFLNRSFWPQLVLPLRVTVYLVTMQLRGIPYCPAAQSTRTVEYSDSAEGWDSPTSVLDMTLNILMVRLHNAGNLKNSEYHFIAIAPKSILSRSGSTWKDPIYASNKTVWHLS